MQFTEWLHLWENQEVSGGITSATGNPGTASYNVSTPKGSRKFIVLFAKNNDELHINFLGSVNDEEGIDKSVNVGSILQNFVGELCQKFGPFDPAKISYKPSGGTRTGWTSDGSAVRDRLFQRYIRQLQQNMPPMCSFAPKRAEYPSGPGRSGRVPISATSRMPAKSKFDNHPLRAAFKGNDEEFASFFGLGSTT
jgi:hypothetical protein